MHSFVDGLNEQLLPLLGEPALRKQVMAVISRGFRDLQGEIAKVLGSIEMLLFQRDLPEVVLRLDAFKTDFFNLETFHKGYDNSARVEIRKQFQT